MCNSENEIANELTCQSCGETLQCNLCGEYQQEVVAGIPLAENMLLSIIVDEKYTEVENMIDCLIKRSSIKLLDSIVNRLNLRVKR